MAKSKKSKPKKQRAKIYHTKLAVNGTFEEVIKVSVTPIPTHKKDEMKK
ncbi:MAG TPA: hypothetical protein VKR53_02940 [Puia sp.]|nr:hypothetical protein [Puia sp.]